MGFVYFGVGCSVPLSHRINLWFTFRWLVFTVNVGNIPYIDPMGEAVSWSSVFGVPSPGTKVYNIISPFSELSVSYFRPNFELKVNDCMSKGISVQKFRLYMEYIPIIQGWFLLFSLNGVMIRLFTRSIANFWSWSPEWIWSKTKTSKTHSSRLHEKYTMSLLNGEALPICLAVIIPFILLAWPRTRGPNPSSHIAASTWSRHPGIQWLVCFEHLIYKSDTMMLMLFFTGLWVLLPHHLLSTILGVFYHTHKWCRKKITWPGDIDVVHCLLCVEQIQVFGQEIFDRRYPGFVLSKDHKSCIKSHGYQLSRCQVGEQTTFGWCRLEWDVQCFTVLPFRLDDIVLPFRLRTLYIILFRWFRWFEIMSVFPRTVIWWLLFDYLIPDYVI